MPPLGLLPEENNLIIAGFGQGLGSLLVPLAIDQVHKSVKLLFCLAAKL